MTHRTDPAHRLAVLCLLVAMAAPGLVFAETSADHASIEAVIDSAYVQGIWVQRDLELIRGGFSPTFVMQIRRDGELSSITLDQWIERMSLGTPNEQSVEAEIQVISQVGDAAVARVDLTVDGKPRFTDFFGLYRAQDGWKIVSKHYHPLS